MFRRIERRVPLAILATLAAGQAIAAEAPAAITIPVSARWLGDPPNRMTIQTDQTDSALSLDQGAGQFRGSVSISTPGADADLLVEYGGNELTLPLRFSAGTPSVALAVKRPGEVKCTAQILAQLGIPAASLGEAVQKYFTAKQIYQITNNDRCGSALQPTAARTWFNASYALVKMKPFFRLDPGALSAYEIVDPKNAKFYQKQSDGVHVAAIYQQSVKLFESGDADSALKVNEQLAAALDQDAGLAKTAKDLQGISFGLLAKDSALFAAKATRPDL